MTSNDNNNAYINKQPNTANIMLPELQAFRYSGRNNREATWPLPSRSHHVARGGE